MICPKCGREIPDGTVCPCSAGAPALSTNPALNVIKTIGSSPMFLVAAVLYSLGVLLTFIGNISASSDVTGWLMSFAYEMDVDMSYLYPYLQGASSTNAFSVVLSTIPAILIAVAFWLHYATCRGMKSGGISTAGLTIWKVMNYISLVCVIVAAVIFAVAFIIILIGGIASGDSDGAAVVGIAILCIIIVGIVFGLVIPYLIAEIRVINRTKNVAATGVPDNRVSQFLIVMNWISAVCAIISALTSLFLSPLVGLAGLASAVAVILETMCLTRYRREMTVLMYPPVQPVYAQPVQPAQPYQAYNQPAAPVQPVQSVQPTAPAEPVQPVEPAAPVEPAQEAGQEEKPEE